MSTQVVDKWKKFYCDSGLGMVWPNESLVRFFKGNYIAGFQDEYQRKKVLDIGFGTGNNLMFFGTLGMELHGVEIHEEICQKGVERLREMGYESDLRPGDNRNIPFPDEYFDYIVPWDVLHYEGEENRIIEAIAEYHRVLKPGGRIFLSTVAPDHTILNGSETLGNHQYRIGRDDDFRKGQIFFYFDAPQYLKFYFSKYFVDILIGRSTLDNFVEINDTFFLTGVRKKL